jgi:hypothetical protein
LLFTGALAMFAPGPTAWPTHAILEFFPSPANAPLSGLLLLGIINPTDELIAGQRCDVLPGVERRGIGQKRLPQVNREFMHHPAGYSRCAHAAECTGVDKGTDCRSEAFELRSAETVRAAAHRHYVHPAGVRHPKTDSQEASQTSMRSPPLDLIRFDGLIVWVDYAA